MATDYDVCVGSEYEDGHLRFKPAGYGESASIGAVDHQAPYGFQARCHDPDLDPDGVPYPDKACQLANEWEGGRCHNFPTIDPRAQKTIPNLKKGGSVHYGGPHAALTFTLIDGENGSWFTYVPFGGKAHAITASTLDGSISIVQADGAMVALTAEGVSIKNVAGDVSHSVGADGHTLFGNTKVYGGLHVGSPAADALVKSTPLLTYLTALEGAIAALATAVDAKLPTAAAPGPAAGGITTAIGAMATAKAAMVAQLAKSD